MEIKRERKRKRFFSHVVPKNKRSKNSGCCLFPEMLITELRAIRSTIEAHSKTSDLEGGNYATVCGIKLEDSSNWNEIFRVRTENGVIVYNLDRLDLYIY